MDRQPATVDAFQTYNALVVALAGSQPPMTRANGDPVARAAWQQWRQDVLRVSQQCGHLIQAASCTQGDFLRACGSPD